MLERYSSRSAMLSAVLACLVPAAEAVAQNQPAAGTVTDDNPAVAAEATVSAEPDSAELMLSSGQLRSYTSRLGLEWEEYLAGAGLRIGANSGDVFVAAGTAVVEFPVEHPGFIESRGFGYEIAFLRAKTEMVRFLGTSGSRTQVLELLERAAWTQGQFDRVQTLRQADRIERKVTDLAETALDAAITNLDPDYDPSVYDERAEKEEAYRAAFRQEVVATASSFVAGAMPLHVYEGSSADGSGYEILVGLVWSPKLARIATSVGDSTRATSAAVAGSPIETSLPADVTELAASWGVTMLVDENAEHVILSFGQAAPRATSQQRRDQANRVALEIAALRAESAIRAFVGETVSSLRSGSSDAVAIEYASAAAGATIDRSFLERLRATTPEVVLKGITTVGEWVIEHPASGQPVAIVAVSWRPSSVRVAERVGEAVQTHREQLAVDTSENESDSPQGIYKRPNIDPEILTE